MSISGEKIKRMDDKITTGKDLFGGIPEYKVYESTLYTFPTVSDSASGTVPYPFFPDTPPPPISFDNPNPPNPNYLPVLERIAKSLEAIVERFC